jgi:hypothetical protein
MDFSPAVTLQTCFNTILGQILQALDYIAKVNRITMQQLQEKKIPNCAKNLKMTNFRYG